MHCVTNKLEMAALAARALLAAGALLTVAGDDSGPPIGCTSSDANLLRLSGTVCDSIGGCPTQNVTNAKVKCTEIDAGAFPTSCRWQHSSAAGAATTATVSCSA